mmetsp:Transcript_109340/g.199187  ORF Transcript_109340/g.199187 Transcript_109340/m.199187 type:complete len:80 (-) Transcript_109340:60-299(-)
MWRDLARDQPAVVHVAGRGGSPKPSAELPEPPPKALSLREMFPSPDGEEHDENYWESEILANLKVDVVDSEQPPTPFWE